MTRREFPKPVKVAAFQRANGHCEKCTAYLTPGKFHYDHVIPDGLGGEPVLSNCEVLCTNCHDDKTRKTDVPQIAKMKRQRESHIGATIKSAGFRKAEPQRTATRPLMKRVAR